MVYMTNEQLRTEFHDWLESQGFARPTTPTLRDGSPGGTYNGSHVQTLWEAYLHATLAERTRLDKDQAQATQ